MLPMGFRKIRRDASREPVRSSLRATYWQAGKTGGLAHQTLEDPPRNSGAAQATRLRSGSTAVRPGWRRASSLLESLSHSVSQLLDGGIVAQFGLTGEEPAFAKKTTADSASEQLLIESS